MKVPLRLDHLLTFVESPLEAHLESYRRAGFLPHVQTARWDPGLHNGFVRFWPEYLELLSVEDEAAFAEGRARYHTLGGPDCHTLRRTEYPYGIGFYAEDLSSLHEHWQGRGFELPEVAFWRLKGTPPDAPPDFAYQELPHALLPGAACFVLRSFSPKAPMRREAWVAPDSAFAISGVTFVSSDPEARGPAWRDLLTPEGALRVGDESCGLRLAPHHLTWLTPGAYEQRYGRAWRPAPHALGELAAVHLLAEDLPLFKSSLREAGWRVVRLEDGTCRVNAERGVSFLVREGAAAGWLEARTALTGEQLELHRAASL